MGTVEIMGGAVGGCGTAKPVTESAPIVRPLTDTVGKIQLELQGCNQSVSRGHKMKRGTNQQSKGRTAVYPGFPYCVCGPVCTQVESGFPDRDTERYLTHLEDNYRAP